MALYITCRCKFHLMRHVTTTRTAALMLVSEVIDQRHRLRLLHRSVIPRRLCRQKNALPPGAHAGESSSRHGHDGRPQTPRSAMLARLLRRRGSSRAAPAPAAQREAASLLSPCCGAA